jgi:AraC-like DNA-binding protein
MDNAQIATLVARNCLSINVTGSGSYEATAGNEFPAHQHTVWEAVYYRQGHLKVAMGEDIYNIEPGVLLITPPKTMHAEYARTAYANYFITVDAVSAHPWPRMCRDNSEGTIGRICANIVREWNMEGDERETLLALLVQQLDIEIRRTQKQQQLSLPEQLVLEAELIIQQRFTGDIRISEVAHDVGTSVSALRGYFVKYRGCSPKEYLQTVRVRSALDMLRNSTITLEHVASLCGYDSASHLTRYVKRMTGTSPGEFRTRMTAGESGPSNLYKLRSGKKLETPATN